MFRKLISTAVLLSMLCGCASTKYGVPEEQYDHMTPNQKMHTRADYAESLDTQEKETRKALFILDVARLIAGGA